MFEPLKVFIGYDPSESIAAQVLAHSIRARASKPVSITFLMLPQLKEIHKRERHPLQSTDFSFTRFLTPYLAGFRGQAIFMDCDMLVLDDIWNLESSNDLAPVSVVKHNHKPTAQTKMLGQTQTQYPCKNWSSLMRFWCAHHDCSNLMPEYVDTATGLELHQFKWVESGAIGRLPHRWNHLVGYDDDAPVEQISCLHWTEGGPWWDRYMNAPYADVWRQEKAQMLRAWERERAAA